MSATKLNQPLHDHGNIIFSIVVELPHDASWQVSLASSSGSLRIQCVLLLLFHSMICSRTSSLSWSLTLAHTLASCQYNRASAYMRTCTWDSLVLTDWDPICCWFRHTIKLRPQVLHSLSEHFVASACVRRYVFQHSYSFDRSYCDRPNHPRRVCERVSSINAHARRSREPKKTAWSTISIETGNALIWSIAPHQRLSHKIPSTMIYLLFCSFVLFERSSLLLSHSHSLSRYKCP